MPTNGIRDLPKKAPAEQVESIVKFADFLSLPFCQLKIRHLFAVVTTMDKPSLNTISLSMLDSIRSAVDSDDSSWVDLVAGLDTNLRIKVSIRACD